MAEFATRLGVPSTMLSSLASRMDTVPDGGEIALPVTVAVTVEPLTTAEVLDGSEPVTVKLTVADVLPESVLVPAKTALNARLPGPGTK